MDGMRKFIKGIVLWFQDEPSTLCVQYEEAFKKLLLKRMIMAIVAITMLFAIMPPSMDEVMYWADPMTLFLRIRLVFCGLWILFAFLSLGIMLFQTQVYPLSKWLTVLIAPYIVCGILPFLVQPYMPSFFDVLITIGYLIILPATQIFDVYCYSKHKKLADHV